MKLLENINKKGIDINNILNMLNKEQKQNNDRNISDINNSNLNTNEGIIKYDDIVLKTDTNNTNNTNNTFVPLNLNEKQKNISSKSCIKKQKITKNKCEINSYNIIYIEIIFFEDQKMIDIYYLLFKTKIKFIY